MTMTESYDNLTNNQDSYTFIKPAMKNKDKSDRSTPMLEQYLSEPNLIKES